MNIERKRPREPVSYHLLCDALTFRKTCEPARFAQAIQHVVSGYVTHEHYARRAQCAASSISWQTLKQQMTLGIAADVNPIASLFPATLHARHFESRWNTLNQCVHFGVATSIGQFGPQAKQIDRVPAVGAVDSGLRAEIMACLLEVLSRERRASVAGSEHAILALASDLEQSTTPACEVIELLYANPCLGVDQCAAMLGASLRTLQRQIARQGMTFALIKQAVRITIAGHRIRHLDESLTATAHAAGFFDSAHMIHAWQDACAISPSMYRAIAKLPPEAR